MLVFDNLRFLEHDMSDALCRLATGDGQEKRALYTDRDLIAFESAKPIILTSISDAATEPDILDRSLIVKFERPEVRRTDDDIDAEFGEMHPRVLGALCFAASLGLDLWTGFQVPSDIRMQIPCRFACGMEPHLLKDGEVVGVYREANEQALATASDDPFVVGFSKWTKTINSWEGTASDLGDALTEHAKNGDDRAKPPKWLPTTPRGVRGKLDKFRDIFRDAGIKITYGTIGRDKDRRASIQIEVGVGGVHCENAAEDNAPRDPTEKTATGVHGVRGVHCGETSCSESPDGDESYPEHAPDSSIPTSGETTHPTHPTHPNATKQGGSSGVHWNGDAPDAPRFPDRPDLDETERLIHEALMNI